MVEELVKFIVASIRNRNGASKMTGTEYGKKNLSQMYLESRLRIRF